MQGADKERWWILCEQAAKEQDPERLMELVKEINDLLGKKQDRLGHVAPYDKSKVRMTKSHTWSITRSVPGEEQGYVYVPGESDEWYGPNVRTVFRGVEGKLFRAWDAWERVARPLIEKADVFGNRGTFFDRRGSEDSGTPSAYLNISQ